MPERAVGHSQQFGGFDLNAVGSTKRFLQETFLKVFDIGFKVEALFWEIGKPAHPGIGGHALGQMLRGEFVGGFQNESAFHRVFQLSNITRPTVALYLFQSFIRNSIDLFSHGGIEPSEKMIREQRYIISSLA